MKMWEECEFKPSVTSPTLFFLSLFVNFGCPSEAVLLWGGCDLLKFENLYAKERLAEMKMRNNASFRVEEKKM